MIGQVRSRAAARAEPAAAERAGGKRTGAGRAAAGPRGRAALTGRRRRRRLPRPSPRLVLAAAAALALCAGGWLWLRNSSLVAVRRVTVAGVSGPDASQIRSALTAAARTMSTLDVKLSALRTAVAPYPVVKHLRVTTQFPHGMRIHVVEQVPVAEVSADGRTIPVSADGTLLHDAGPVGPLPSISLSVIPGGTHVTGAALAGVRILAAAPYPLLARVAGVALDAPHGFVAQLRNGPRIYFGSSSELSEKWLAAAAVLADPNSAGATYIDVTDPRRPAAGAPASGSTASAGTAASTGAAAATSTGASAATSTGAGAATATGATAPTAGAPSTVTAAAASAGG